MMKTRIAGVTFNNEVEDGGKNRQEILKELCLTRGNIITVDLKYTTYNGEPAIKCIEHTTRQVIGWIPKTDIANMQHHQMTGFIDHSKKGYSVRLDEQIAPSRAQYHTVKQVCAKNGMVMPAYDRRAYTQIFVMLRSN